MRINESGFVESSDYPPTGLNRVILETLKKQDSLCSKCEKSEKKLCAGQRYFVDRESTPTLKIELKDCYRVAPQVEDMSGVKLLMARIPTDEVDRIMASRAYPNVKLTEKAVKVEGKQFPAVGVVRKSVTVSGMRKYYELMAGMVEKGFTTALIVPSACVESPRSREDWQDYFQETDFMVVYKPEEVIPKSPMFSHLIGLITYRIGAGRPTWLICSDLDTFSDFSDREGHVLSGLSEDAANMREVKF